MKTEELLAGLTRDLAPVRRLPPPSRRLGHWLAVALPFLLLVVAVAGPRPDLGQRLAEPRFVLETAAALATGLCAGWAALASTVPGVAGRWLLLPLLPAGVWLASIGGGCWQDWLRLGAGFAAPVLDQVCLPEIAATSVLPLAALILLSRRGAALRPGRSGALAALAAAALASAALNLFHHDGAAMVTLVWHFGGTALIAGLGGLGGSRLFGRVG